MTSGKHTPKGGADRGLKRLALAAMLAVAIGGTAFGAVRTTGDDLDCGASDSIRIPRPLPKHPLYLSQNYGRPSPYFDNMPPEERSRMQRQYREWQSLPPDQRDTMRRRMDEWNRMPQQERDRYQQRYQQWRQLSPEERRRMENNLQRWDNLSPQERDSIRRRFKN
jgi:catalase